MKYNVAFKHLEKIAKNSKSTRSVLQGIHHLDNQVQATDSYRLLKVVADKKEKKNLKKVLTYK